MKRLTFFFGFLFFINSAMAMTVLKKAVLRDENFHVKIANVELANLLSDQRYEGKYFKIVLGKNDEAIAFDAPENLQLKAATTYYHLNKAREFFADKIHSEYVKALPQITVRLDITNVFNEVGHFSHDNLDPQFNNALSVPGGQGYEPKRVLPWNMEIWFRPAKEFNIDDFSSADQQSIKASLVSFRNQTHMLNLEQFITSLLLGINNDTSAGQFMRLAGSSVLIEAIYQGSDFAADFFSRKIYRLDSALVPEIIYHEFSHIALSEHLELSHSTAVNEGMADFFAGKISNSKKLATNIKEYNLFSGKSVKRKQQYRMLFEKGEYANTDFVFGLLWSVGETVGTDREEAFMFNMAAYLTSVSNIREGLINATLLTCKQLCKEPLNDRLKLYRLYNAKNL